MKNFGFVLFATASKSHLFAGDATPRRADTLGSSTPTFSPTHDPNDMPPAHSGAPGKRAAITSRPARKSSHSPRPSSQLPSLFPTPRKLKRSTAQPTRESPFAA